MQVAGKSKTTVVESKQATSQLVEKKLIILPSYHMYFRNAYSCNS